MSAKTPISKTKATPSLARLATNSLWKQSIDAGCADELVAALQGSAAGRKALARVRPKVQKVFCVAMAGQDGICDGTFAYIPTSSLPWLATLVRAYDKPPEVWRRSPLGGVLLEWQEVQEAADWAMEMLHELEMDAASEMIENFLNVELDLHDYDDDEPSADDEECEDYSGAKVRAWLDDHVSELAEAFLEKFETAFDERAVEARALKPPAVENGSIKTVAMIKIDLSSWN